MFTCHPLPRHQHGWPHVREGVGGVQRAGDDTKWRSDVYEVVGHPDRSGKCCSDEKLIFSRLLWRRWDQWNKKRLLEGVSTFKSKSIGVKNTNPRRVDTLIAKKSWHNLSTQSNFDRRQILIAFSNEEPHWTTKQDSLRGIPRTGRPMSS